MSEASTSAALGDRRLCLIRTSSALQKSGWILLGNRQEPQCRTLRTSRALLPTLHGLRADTEKVREYDLACVQAFSDMPNLLRFETLRWRWNNGDPQINLLPALISQRVSQ